MIKIVLDTNVFVSGIFWSGAPFDILNAWQQKKINLMMSSTILDEYIRVGNILAKKYKGVYINPIIELVTINSEMHTPIELSEQISADPDDEKFIECAISSNCKIIVSGDKHLLDISGYLNINVLKPRAFVDEYL